MTNTPEYPPASPPSTPPTGANGTGSPRRPRAALISAGGGVAAVLALAAACSITDAASSSDTGHDGTPAEGPADELTTVDPDTIPGLEEESTTEDDGVPVAYSYPVIPNADPLAERLSEIAEREADAFVGAVPDAADFSIDWQISAAGDGVIAVRLTQAETDSEGERAGYATYWYDTSDGHTGASTELLAGNAELAELDTLVRTALEDSGDVDTSAIRPVARLYDSMGFNPDGDLVVEFDEGQVAPADSGRIRAVVPEDDAAPLLSAYGERAQEAAVVVTPDFEVSAPPTDGEDHPPAPGTSPGAGEEDVDCAAADSKCVALTFDDGPGARTGEVLDALAEHDAKATFFVTGGPIREHPEFVRRTFAEGHQLGNHTVDHPDLATLGAGGIRTQLNPVNDLVYRETGLTMDLMRPPYGSTGPTVEEVTRDLGQAQILWSVDTRDWKDRDSEKVADRAVSGAEPGAIILMHDIHDSTVDAVPEIVQRLDEQGYTMVTVSQLLGETEPGNVYRDGAPDPEDGGEDAN
ncbi:polysaccharide deacetylase family protein [Nocardiopsis sediminis]|uniref:Polysaccharide deacetylase family protein n=1 Tax=Nocardiopsis sediminis TaxID=1778267 RepID=A0ABV8FLT7_9ACTN